MRHFLKKHRLGIAGTLIFHILMVIYFTTSRIALPPFEKKTIALMELDFTEPEVVDEPNPEEESLEKEELTEEDINAKIQNLMRDANDKRKLSSKNYSEQEIEEQLNEKYKNLEQQIIEERKALGKGFDPSKYAIPEKTTENSKDNATTPKSENQAAGRVITECDIPGRRCSAKTPAYRCMSSGKIFVDIKINQKGEVTSAKIDESRSTSTNECLINEALKYAKRSKANQDFTAPNSVNGSISYNFIGQ